MAKESKLYEISYLIDPDMSEEDAGSVEQDLKTLLGSHDARIDSWDSPKKKRLAYRILNRSEAYIGALRFNGSPSQSGPLALALKKNGKVLRSMLLEWEKPPPQRKRAVPLKAEPPAPSEETHADTKTLDKKLEEILGNNNESQ